MRSPRTPEKSPKKGKIEYCEDINQEFAIKTTDLFSSMFESAYINQISIRPVKNDSTENIKKTPEKNLAYNSAILDCRLKRFVNQRNEKDKNSQTQFEEKLPEIQKILNEDVNLDDVFALDQSYRSEIPLYFKNEFPEEEKSEKEDLKRISPRGIGIAEFTQQYTIRLAKQEQLLQEKKAKREQKIKELEKSYKDQLNSHLSAINMPKKPSTPKAEK